MKSAIKQLRKQYQHLGIVQPFQVCRSPPKNRTFNSRCLWLVVETPLLFIPRFSHRCCLELWTGKIFWEALKWIRAPGINNIWPKSHSDAYLGHFSRWLGGRRYHTWQFVAEKRRHAYSRPPTHSQRCFVCTSRGKAPLMIRSGPWARVSNHVASALILQAGVVNFNFKVPSSGPLISPSPYSITLLNHSLR